MAEEQPSTREKRSRRSTAKRGGLRRFNNIESAIVESTFDLSLPQEASPMVRSEVSANSSNVNQIGEGCYVSATVHNRRYYGVLVDQAALKAASLLHFQDEASSLDLNRRMKMLREKSRMEQQSVSSNGDMAEVDSGSIKRPLEPSVDTEQCDKKRPKTTKYLPAVPVQKFRYVDGSKGQGYRLLLATYASIEAASEGHEEKGGLIEKACQNGGDFVGEFYYQYQVIGTTLQTSKRLADMDMRTSLGFESFLHNTPLPVWYPLSNLQTGQQKVLSMLQMKKDGKGGIEWDNSAATEASTSESKVFQGTHIPMEPRSRFRIGILGGGLAGLSTATELLRLSEGQDIDLEVVLLEGRSRLGGRLCTDTETFQCGDGATPFPVDLGASWIHGIDDNPLAHLARQSGADFVRASEEVKMIGESMVPVNPEIDAQTGRLFDTLLDQAAEDIWDESEDDDRDQRAVRWYASILRGGSADDNTRMILPSPTDAPRHRISSDVSIDRAIGKAIVEHKRREFSKLSEQEHRLLLWNTKNIEYALGANVCDLSMMFWDSDDRHAFEGDHVLLRQGYSHVVQHMVKGLEAKAGRFQCMTNFPVGSVAYSRKSTSKPYPNSVRKLLDLSDTCCVTSQSGERSLKFDFLVSTLPLGVLKDSISKEDTPEESKVSFLPELPFVKQDAIRNVGFGLLNKVYLQFPSAFWRTSGILENGQTLFGNASTVNPQYYMFFDVGLSLGREIDPPAVLMTLISGKEAVELEQKTDQVIVDDVVKTLCALFDGRSVPNPVTFKVTRWGCDPFSRGCYSFLPPGATDQDFQILQSPVNGNGDSLLLDKAETMRLFWAGEHTTALHPSMAHGALLSGIRAAKEVIDTICFSKAETPEDTDTLIPLAIFREKNPSATLKCTLCHLSGSRIREGSLLAFQRGARQILVHNNCAEYSPEVEVQDGHWRDVIKAANRGAKITCELCQQHGATAGCTHERCFRSYHFSCAEDTGWRFERDGKEFYCDLHRQKTENGELVFGAKAGECDKISLHFFRSKNPTAAMKCGFCKAHGLDKERGKLLAFQQRNSRLLVHEKCARFTNIISTLEEEDAGEDFRNLFEAKARSKFCTECGEAEATVICTEPSCNKCFHVPCCSTNGWDFRRKGRDFRCEEHRGGLSRKANRDIPPLQNGAPFQHSLFALPGAETLQNGASTVVDRKAPRTATDVVKLEEVAVNCSESTNDRSTKSNESDENEYSSDENCDIMKQSFSIDLSEPTGLKTVTIRRGSKTEPWSLCLAVTARNGTHFALMVDYKSSDAIDPYGLRHGDRIVTIDGTKVGFEPVANLAGVLAVMKQAVALSFQVEPRAVVVAKHGLDV